MAKTIIHATTKSAGETLSADTDWNPAHTIEVDTINATHIDWGSGANQVDVDDVPESATYKYLTLAAQNITGVKSFLSFPVTPSSAPTTDYQVGNKKYTDDAIKLGTAITFIIDGGGSAITTGIKGDIRVPFGCTITKATLLADQSGSIVIDVWKQAYADYPPENANSITASAPPTISGDTDSEDATLTGWTTAITAGDTLRFNVDSVATVERITLTLNITRT